MRILSRMTNKSELMWTSNNAHRHADTESISTFTASPLFQEIAGHARNDGSATNSFFKFHYY